MSDKAFLDTNVLVYAIEIAGKDPAKSERARALLRGSDLCLSTQVLGEFYRAVTHPKRTEPLTHREAVAWLQIWKRYEVGGITVEHVDLALELRDRFHLSFYDALILSAARLADCRTVHSEDMNSGQDYGGVYVVNPFLKV